MMDSVNVQTSSLQHEVHRWRPEYNSDGCTNFAAIYRWGFRLHILHSRGRGYAFCITCEIKSGGGGVKNRENRLTQLIDTPLANRK
ncbi:hypothetical protein EVAR_12156_1 [Eumeta japonica]|uniref:Uncharacterized protein n=1 Tax=Eumeta variegata TaxID=151549 RepID=A0A4C1UH90_EUMVA|nr:hypothetical protein EVAR_12156_1 [Eumeta japonica]